MGGTRQIRVEMRSEILGAITIAFYISGIIFAVIALWRSRTPQGATAWVVGLLGFPFLAVPAFLVFGRNKFYGYVKERRELDRHALREADEIEGIYKTEVFTLESLIPLSQVAAVTKQPGFMAHSRTHLLVNADRAFPKMLDEIERAQKYILLQTYIFRDDRSGRKFIEALKRKARQGIRIYFLYDGIGTKISRKLRRELISAGIEIEDFENTKTLLGRLQINFRNHRKVLVIDGKVGFVGGLNIGDDYLGRWKSMGPWRDTHLRIEGPAALSAQLSFLKDWHWACERTPDLDWIPDKCSDGAPVMVLHTGPADEIESCLQAHLTLILAAKKRIWIANPYFVPSEGLSNALTLAVLRGVDVRILVPSYGDNALVMAAMKTHIDRLLQMGVKFYRYLPGFLHEKVMLIDDCAGSVGSANLDSRSLFINFEIMAIAVEKNFIHDMEEMLKNDFSNSTQITSEYMRNLPFRKKLFSRAANLLAPII